MVWRSSVCLQRSIVTINLEKVVDVLILLILKNIETVTTWLVTL
jgi:hypothetical protein